MLKGKIIAEPVLKIFQSRLLFKCKRLYEKRDIDKRSHKKVVTGHMNFYNVNDLINVYNDTKNF